MNQRKAVSHSQVGWCPCSKQEDHQVPLHRPIGPVEEAEQPVEEADPLEVEEEATASPGDGGIGRLH